MSHLRQDLRQGLRLLVRAPAFSLLAVLTFAVGIGINTAIFSVLHAVVLRPLPYAEPARLVSVTTQFPTMGFTRFFLSPEEFHEYRAWSTSFESMGAYTVGAANVGTDQPFRTVRAFVTDDLFAMLGVAPVWGRGFTVDDTETGAEPTAILSHELAERAFGSGAAAVGRQVSVDSVAARIVGVMPRGFDLLDYRVELWMPRAVAHPPSSNRGNHTINVIGRLKRTVSLDQARTELATLTDRWMREFPSTHAPSGASPTNHRIVLGSLAADSVGESGTMLWLLQGAVGFVLLIACANVAHLLLARAGKRSVEFAVRAALGADARRLRQQVLSEAFVLGLIAAVVGIALAKAGLAALVSSAADNIPNAGRVGLNLEVLLFTVSTTLVTAIAAGMTPLLVLRSRNFQAAVASGRLRMDATGGISHRLGRPLIAIEVALALVLLAGAGLLLRSFDNMTRVDPGFDRNQLVTFGLVLPAAQYPGATRVPFFTALLERLRHLPGVDGVAAMSGLPPLRGLSATDADFEHIPNQVPGAPDTGLPQENIDYWQYATVDYVNTLRIPVVRGRAFTAADVGGPPVVMINEALARRFYGDADPVGARIRPGFGRTREWATVIGVLKDVKQNGVTADAGTELYVLYEQAPSWVGFAGGNMNIVMRSGMDPDGLARAVREVIASADPTLPIVRYRSMERVLIESIGGTRLTTMLLSLFAVVAVLLAGIGTYGVITCSLAERRREIAIRLALGASRGQVVWLAMRHGLVPTSVGVVTGLAVAIAASDILQSTLFGIDPLDPMVLGAGALLASLICAVACLWPAYRAGITDPCAALRKD